MTYKHVAIVALRRSGTTITWKTFRQDPKFLCFNEPFCGRVIYGLITGKNHPESTWDEWFIHKDLIFDHHSFIEPFMELIPVFTGNQQAYLKALFSRSEHVCIDFTRILTRINLFRQIVPDALVVLLIRDPRAWVTSQLKPKGLWLEKFGLPDNFFTYPYWCDNWGYQTIANNTFPPDREAFMHERLLYVWNGFMQEAHKQNVDMIVQFEDFCMNPLLFLREIYAKLGIPEYDWDLTPIHAPNVPYQHDHQLWDEAIGRTIDREFRKYVWDYARITKKEAAIL